MLHTIKKSRSRRWFIYDQFLWCLDSSLACTSLWCRILRKLARNDAHPFNKNENTCMFKLTWGFHISFFLLGGKESEQFKPGLQVGWRETNSTSEVLGVLKLLWHLPSFFFTFLTKFQICYIYKSPLTLRGDITWVVNSSHLKNHFIKKLESPNDLRLKDTFTHHQNAKWFLF